MSREEIDQLRALLGKATPGPWGYRVREHDDWGMIRGAETEWSIGPVRPIVALSRDASAATDFDEHRRNGTDPYEPNGKLIVAAVNALPALLDLIEAQREALEGLLDRDKLQEVIHRVSPMDGWQDSGHTADGLIAHFRKALEGVSGGG